MNPFRIEVLRKKEVLKMQIEKGKNNLATKITETKKLLYIID